MLKFFVILMLLGASAGVQGASERQEDSRPYDPELDPLRPFSPPAEEGSTVDLRTLLSQGVFSGSPVDDAPNDPSRPDYDPSRDPLAPAASGLTRTDTVGSGSLHMAVPPFPFRQPDDDDDDEEPAEAAVARPAVRAASSSAESASLRRDLHLAEAGIEALRRASVLSAQIWRKKIAAAEHAAAEAARAEERARSRRKIGAALGREAATNLLLAEEQRKRDTAEEEAATLRSQLAALEKELEAARAAGPAAATPPRATAAAAPTPPTRKRRPRLKLKVGGMKSPAPAGKPAKRRSDGRHVGSPEESAHPRGTRVKPAHDM